MKRILKVELTLKVAVTVAAEDDDEAEGTALMRMPVEQRAAVQQVRVGKGPWHNPRTRFSVTEGDGR